MIFEKEAKLHTRVAVVNYIKSLIKIGKVQTINSNLLLRINELLNKCIYFDFKNLIIVQRVNQLFFHCNKHNNIQWGRLDEELTIGHHRLQLINSYLGVV